MGGWLGIIGTLGGVVIGGFVTYFVNRWKFEQERDDRQRVAAMQIAAQLQIWLVETMRTFRDHHVFYQPDPEEDPGDPHGYFFPTPGDIPPFSFADDLDRIAQLKNADAERVFRLVQKRASAEREARITAEIEDYEEAAEIFQPLIAQLWLESLGIYQALTEPLLWGADVVTAGELADMHRRAAPKPAAPVNDELAAIP